MQLGFGLRGGRRWDGAAASTAPDSAAMMANRRWWCKGKKAGQAGIRDSSGGRSGRIEASRLARACSKANHGNEGAGNLGTPTVVSRFPADWGRGDGAPRGWRTGLVAMRSASSFRLLGAGCPKRSAELVRGPPGETQAVELTLGGDGRRWEAMG